MRKFVSYTLFVLLVIILGVIMMGCSSSPLRKSEVEIREDILKITPIGAGMDEVLELIENKEEWEIIWVDNENRSDHTNLSGDYIIGEKSIKAYIGKYSGFFTNHVEVYWGFDEESRLIEIGVRKTSDSF